MTNLKRILCCFVLFATTAVSPANAWHGYGFGGHCLSGGFNGYGYGFGLNHHSFRPSYYNPGWSSYSRASFYSSYGYGGCWPRTSYYATSYAPVYYTNFRYYAPTYYAPSCYSTYYTPYVAPVIYSNVYSGFPSCAVTPSVSNLPAAAYAVKKPVSNSAPIRFASQLVQQSAFAQAPVTQVPVTQVPVTQAPAGRYVLAQGANGSTSALDTAPQELIDAADAILAAGGYRQAAKAYAQIVVKYGNSDRLVTRRFVAQVANGDYEQAAVVIELALANGNRIDRSDLPKGDLQQALGDSTGLIATRSEGLAAIALEKSEDAVPMLTVANWLALSGDDHRAQLFKARVDQMKEVQVGLLVRNPPATKTAN